MRMIRTQDPDFTLYEGDALQVLRGLEDGSVDMCCTSPPYWGLRNYGHHAQLGLEDTPNEYVANMVCVFRQVRRVLRDDGTLWLNLGDSYLAKNLVGIPWRVAFALQQDGWFLRSDIIWSKPNPMPESVTDRPTKSHEYVFLLSKSSRYCFDVNAVREPHSDRALRDVGRTVVAEHVTAKHHSDLGDMHARYGTDVYRATLAKNGGVAGHPDGRNIRSVWEIATQSYSEAHFATFPPELVRRCILAGCPEGGTVLDPFGGAGTTALVARNLGRHSILIELNADYCALASERLQQQSLLALSPIKEKVASGC
jgi:DNA modification methylase